MANANENVKINLVRVAFQETGKFVAEVYKDKKMEWRWRLRAANKKVLADSGEGYKNKKDCLEALAMIVQSPFLKPR